MGGFSWAVLVMYYLLGAGLAVLAALWNCPSVFGHADRTIVYAVLVGLIALGGGLGGLIQDLPSATPPTHVIPNEGAVNTRLSLFLMSASIALGAALLGFALYRLLAHG